VSQATRDTLTEAREAFEKHSWEEAVELLGAAQEAEGVLPAEDLERLGEAARWGGRFDLVLDAWERAVAAYEREGDRRGAGRVALKLGNEHYARGNDALMAGWLGRAGRLLEDEGDSHERGLLLWFQASERFGAGDIEGGRKILQEVLAMARRTGDGDLEALALSDQGHALLTEGKIEEGAALIDEAGAAAMSGQCQLWTSGYVFCGTIFSCRNRGDWQRAGEWSEASLRWCQRHSLSFFPGICRFHHAEVQRLRGRLEEAEREVSEAIEELLAASPRFAPWGLHELGEIRRRKGDLEGAAEVFQRCVELGWEPQPGLTLLRLDQGRPEVAKRMVVQALADEEMMAQQARPLILPVAVSAGIAGGDMVLARSAADELESRAEALGTVAVRASAQIARGQIALADSRFEEAAEALRAGRNGWRQVDAPYEAAQACMLLAEAHRGLGDDDSAGEEIAAAKAAFERIGAAREARRASSQLAPEKGVRATRAFLFTDIVDSTKLLEAVGDEAWSSLLAWHDRTLRSCFKEHSGEEIDHAGDGFFVAFPDAASALACACGIQRALSKHRREHGFAPSVRIGVHVAEVTDRGGDYEGRGVHAAARVAAAAGGGEVLASLEALEAAGDGFAANEERSIEAKGFSEPLPVACVNWRDEDR
jgi:class 3 adenylate cyclase